MRLFLMLYCVGTASGFVPPCLPHQNQNCPSWSGARVPASRGDSVAPNLFGLFGGGIKKMDGSLELKELIIDGLRSGNELAGEDKARADRLIAELSAKSVAFSPSILGGGPWRAVYTKGPEPKWKSLTKLIPIGKSRASQDYDTASKTVTNSAEVLGELIKVQAFGQYEQADLRRTTPKDFKVTVERGVVQVGGLSFGLGIKGVGRQRVLFADGNLRIFQSLANTAGGWEEQDLVVVQIPETSLSGV